MAAENTERVYSGRRRPGRTPTRRHGRVQPSCRCAAARGPASRDV